MFARLDPAIDGASFHIGLACVPVYKGLGFLCEPLMSNPIGGGDRLPNDGVQGLATGMDDFSVVVPESPAFQMNMVMLWHIRTWVRVGVEVGPKAASQAIS
jgi:hypothetical protein